jgi:hypothetical protein
MDPCNENIYFDVKNYGGVVIGVMVVTFSVGTVLLDKLAFILDSFPIVAGRSDVVGV